MNDLFRPKAYFTSMETGGGIGEPLIKALIWGIVGGVFILMWSLLDIIGVTTGTFSGNVGVIGFFANIAGAVVGVFIGGLILLILSYICSGKRNYKANMREKLPSWLFYRSMLGLDFLAVSALPWV